MLYAYTVIIVYYPLNQNNGQCIKWDHLRELFEKVSGTAIASKGITLLPKLKMEHICLTSYSRMCVDLAAQVSKYKYNHCMI